MGEGVDECCEAEVLRWGRQGEGGLWRGHMQAS